MAGMLNTGTRVLMKHILGILIIHIGTRHKKFAFCPRMFHITESITGIILEVLGGNT